jgi:nitroreductase
VNVDDAIRTRRTHKVYGDEPVDRATVEEILDLARWAPNHHLTNPWRFRVLGPRSLQRLKDAADAGKPGSGAKLDRAPTLVAVSYVGDEEDRDATAAAAYAVLLAAHARGLATYWRTPEVLVSDEGRAALGLGDDERAIGLLHLGPLRQAQPPPERASLDRIAFFLD